MVLSQRDGIPHEDIAGTQTLVISLLGILASPLIPITPPSTTILPKIGARVKSVFAPLLRCYAKGIHRISPVRSPSTGTPGLP